MDCDMLRCFSWDMTYLLCDIFLYPKGYYREVWTLEPSKILELLEYSEEWNTGVVSLGRTWKLADVSSKNSWRVVQVSRWNVLVNRGYLVSLRHIHQFLQSLTRSWKRVACVFRDTAAFFLLCNPAPYSSHQHTHSFKLLNKLPILGNEIWLNIFLRIFKRFK